MSGDDIGDPSDGPLLAIVVPVRDRTELLGRTLASLAREVGADTEVVLVDDGSLVPVEQVVLRAAGLRGRVVRIDHGGVCAARNAGVDATSAPMVAFLDSDDECAPGAGAVMEDAARRGVDVLVGAATMAYDDGRQEVVARPVPVTHDPTSLGAFLAGTFAVRRDAFLAAGGYRVGLRYGENTELGLRLGLLLADRQLTVETCDQPLVLVHARARRYDPALMHEAASLVLPALDRVWARSRRLHATYLGIAGVAASRLGRRREAVRLLAKSWWVDKRQWKQLARLARAALRPPSRR